MSQCSDASGRRRMSLGSGTSSSACSSRWSTVRFSTGQHPQPVESLHDRVHGLSTRRGAYWRSEVMNMKVRRILVIANQTACSQPLLDMVAERIGDGSAQVTLLVPATHPGGQATWTEGGAHRAAEQRLREAADRFRSAGIEIQGVVGDANPVTAVGACCRSPLRRDRPLDASARRVALAENRRREPAREAARIARHRRRRRANGTGCRLTGRVAAQSHHPRCSSSLRRLRFARCSVRTRSRMRSHRSGSPAIGARRSILAINSTARR